MCDERFILVTLHRPSNVDNPDFLKQLVILFNKLAEDVKIIFPVHPRALKNLNGFEKELSQNVILTEPVGYLDFIALMNNAEIVITDSGGIQEETTYLGISCLTLRENTERPVTIKDGTNLLLGVDLEKVKETAHDILNGVVKNGKVPELWDGDAAIRIVADILKLSLHK